MNRRFASRLHYCNPPQWLSVVAFLGALVTMAGLSTTAFADNIVVVEEDWELAVGEPDADSQAPQVTMIMSPRGNLAGRYFAFDLNHQSLPEFQGGGMQTQVWNFDEPVLSQNYSNCDTLNCNEEVVTWTQRMTFSGGTLMLEVLQGNSSTWGNFGGPQLTISTETGVEHLNAYNPETSVFNSGVGYASNRVHWLKLKAVRYYSAAGLVSEDNSVRTVYQHQ